MCEASYEESEIWPPSGRAARPLEGPPFCQVNDSCTQFVLVMTTPFASRPNICSRLRTQGSHKSRNRTDIGSYKPDCKLNFLTSVKDRRFILYDPIASRKPLLSGYSLPHGAGLRIPA